MGSVQNLVDRFPPTAYDITRSVCQTSPYSIGSGSMGDVYEGFMNIRISNTLQVAIKRLRPLEKIEQRLYREFVVWAPLRHPNIVQFLGVVYDAGRPLGLVTPFLPKKLLSFIGMNPSMEWKRHIARQVVEGLNYLHMNHVVHGDLKPDNVMMTAENEVKIIDFGIAQIVDVRGFTTRIERNFRHTAPELMPIEEDSDELPRPTPQSDIFSFGMLFLQILHGPDFDAASWRDRCIPYNHLPRAGESEYSILMRVHRGERPLRHLYRPDIPPVYWSLMERCWDRYPSQRPSVADIIRRL